MLLVMMLGLLFLAAAAYFLGDAVTAPARERQSSMRRAVRHLPARPRARAAAVQGARARSPRRPAREVDIEAAPEDDDRRGQQPAARCRPRTNALADDLPGPEVRLRNRRARARRRLRRSP